MLQLQVVIDEIVSNVIKYAWPEGGTHKLNVRISAQGDEVHVEVIDDGQAFDPLTVPPPRPAAPGRRPQPGGVGIHMVRQLVDALVYERSGERNHIVIKKRCASCAPRH
jgi:serine/threonine-protein kinase RsbW